MHLLDRFNRETTYLPVHVHLRGNARPTDTYRLCDGRAYVIDSSMYLAETVVLCHLAYTRAGDRLLRQDPR